VHVGAVIVPGRGGAGVTGWLSISACPEGGEMHSVEMETVKVYVPVGRFGTIAVVPDPSKVIPPGLTVTVQSAFEGNRLNSTVPVDNIQVG
jgi:hypothetical protein